MRSLASKLTVPLRDRSDRATLLSRLLACSRPATDFSSSPRAMMRCSRACGLPSLSALGFFGRLTLPALLLNGRFESKFQPLRDLALTLLPTLEVVDLEGGHCINVECADAANAAVVSFFERLIRPNEPAAQAPKQQGLLT